MRKNVTLLSFSDLYYELFQMKIDVVVNVDDMTAGISLFCSFADIHTYHLVEAAGSPIIG